VSHLLRGERLTLVRGGRLLFEGLELTLGSGDALHVKGVNGSGKSSLLRLAAGLLRPTAGRLERSGAALCDEALALEVQQVEWVKEIAANASERAKDPMAGSAEALRVESELAQERQKLAAMLREREQRARQLNLLLGRPAAQPWAKLSLPGIASAPELQKLLARLSTANPRLQSLRHMADAATAEAADDEDEIRRR